LEVVELVELDDDDDEESVDELDDEPSLLLLSDFVSEDEELDEPSPAAFVSRARFLVP
jgi:hypothetical protein